MKTCSRLVSHRVQAALIAVLLAALAPVGAARAAWDWRERKPGVVAGGRFTPGRPPLARFGDDPGLGCPESSLSRGLQEQIQASARSGGREAPRPDGRLCAVAEALLGWDQKENPREGVMAFLSQYFGLTASVSRLTVGVVPTDDSRVLADRITEAIAGASRSATAPRYGIATQRLGSYAPRGGAAPASTRVVIVVLDVPLALEPFPRRLALGEKARLSGKLLGDLASARVALSDVMGRLSTPPVPAGRSFEAEVACGDKAGRIQVEIGGELGGSPALAARFPVACGTELATSVPLADTDPWPGAPEKQAHKMVDLINAERTAVGLKALEWDEGLAGVARGISDSVREEVRRGSFDAPGDVLQRLKKMGIASTLVLQNPAQAPSAAAAHQQLLDSPGHRANLMNPEVNKAGAGIVPETGKDGTSSVFVTQLFIKELPPLDPEAVRTQLRAAVAQKRKDARQPPVAFDPQLEELAQRYAADLAAAGGALPKARKDELTAALNRSFKTVHVLAGARAEPSDFAEEPDVVSAGKFAGVGAALGMHSTLGRNAVYAVILLGAKR